MRVGPISLLANPAWKFCHRQTSFAPGFPISPKSGHTGAHNYSTPEFIGRNPAVMTQFSLGQLTVALYIIFSGCLTVNVLTLISTIIFYSFPFTMFLRFSASAKEFPVLFAVQTGPALLFGGVLSLFLFYLWFSNFTLGFSL